MMRVDSGVRGRPRLYPDHPIETTILMRQVFLLSLRQTEGFMKSLSHMKPLAP